MAYSAPASPPFDDVEISLLEYGDGLSVYDKSPVLSLGCTIGPPVDGITVVHANLVAEINEEVIIHFARLAGSLVTRRPIGPNVFPQTFPFLKWGWHCKLCLQ